MRTERQHTIQHLVASTISVAAFVIAALFNLSQFLTPEALALFAGLFAAAFSLGARPSSPTISRGVLYFGSDDFHLYAIRLNDHCGDCLRIYSNEQGMRFTRG